MSLYRPHCSWSPETVTYCKYCRAALIYQQLRKLINSPFTCLQLSIWADLLGFSSFLVSFLCWVGGHVGVGDICWVKMWVTERFHTKLEGISLCFRNCDKSSSELTTIMCVFMTWFKWEQTNICLPSYYSSEVRLIICHSIIVMDTAVLIGRLRWAKRQDAIKLFIFSHHLCFSSAG